MTPEDRAKQAFDGEAGISCYERIVVAIREAIEDAAKIADKIELLNDRPGQTQARAAAAVIASDIRALKDGK